MFRSSLFRRPDPFYSSGTVDGPPRSAEPTGCTRCRTPVLSSASSRTHSGWNVVLDLPRQGWLWAALFAVFAIGCSVVAWRFGQGVEPVDEAQLGIGEVSPAADGGAESLSGTYRVGSWLLLTFMSSVMFLATTNQLSQDVASVPFLWVLPIAIYLLTYIVCFDKPHWSSRRWPVMVAAVSAIPRFC